MRYLCLLLIAGLAQASVMNQVVRFQPSQFEFSEQDNYAVVLGTEMDVTVEPGAPQLPARPMSIELGGDCRVTDVRIRASDWQELESRKLVFPCQEQVILSKVSAVDRLTEAKAAIYRSAEPYPEQAGVWTGLGHQQGNTIVDVVLYPVRYIGAEQKLEYCPRFEVEVEYEPGPRRLSPESDGIEYVIVTSASYDSIFQRLADWKTQKGVPAVVRHTSWVYANYSGRDNAERLREYLRTLPDSGVKYVLLGGDVSVVPYRKCFAMVSEGGIEPREDSLPCDLYFADLDGDWDANQNDVFGEVADSIDLYAELLVGRAPVDSRSEAQAFVNKVLEYEQNPAGPCQDKALFFAEVMWSNPYTDGGKHKDMLEAQSFASGYTVTKKYQRLGNLSRSSVMQAMRDGQNFQNHDGHGWIDVMSCGQGSSLRKNDADTITNAYRGVLYSIGCWTTAFDYSSIGEAFVTNPDGGMVAMIGNSSYGWGSPGNPGFGYSDKFDDKFWWMALNAGHRHIGEGLTRSKEYFAPFSRGRNVYRWHQYQVNLMGCPEMSVWTALPGSLDVTGPAEIPMAEGEVQVLVADANGPVENALVCLMKEGESYSRGRTDAAGRVWLGVSAQTSGEFTLTATAHNHLPAETAIPTAGGAYVNFAGWGLVDSLGNDDGIANPGETVGLPVRLHNAGTETSGAIAMTLRTDEPFAQILDSTASAAALNAGDSVLIADAFEVSIGPCPIEGSVFRFDLVLTDSKGTRTFHPVILVGMPVLELERYFLVSPPALPGEDKALKVAIENQGHGFGHSTWAKLTSLDSNVTVLAPESILLGELDPLSLSIAEDSFRVSIASSCPGSYLAEMQLDIWCASRSFNHSFELLVGEYGFSDDMESGEAKWTHGGSGDPWHRSTYRYHSENHSWYCGNEGTHRYSNNMNANLQTVPFMVAEHCSLKFWRWFSVPNYGVDGIYVVLLRDAGADTLDFIGTGGALEKTRHALRPTQYAGAGLASGMKHVPYGVDGIESDWFQEQYDLSLVSVGETIQVRIGFKSDNDGDIDEGFYIDDFEVTGGGPPQVAIAEPEPGPRRPMAVRSWPNPFRGTATVWLQGCPVRYASGRVYDASGRVVRHFTVPVRAGSAEWVWTGTDDAGQQVAAGAYFVEVRSGDETGRVRVLLTR